ncbi:outer membrane protein assembly factor [Fertoebacter nigrum]|uniref:Outer membrane protein assembly factor n=1 Tax=Fertoeibacter niger TaxID=2656921 RepID=A0A8X8KPZ0_9RHOB|nr:autotransporter assembly complex family protein [Fertoeibacter niger]NUB45396.1 outer membrane protein assembly factor [Fertoeibacter niger]
MAAPAGYALEKIEFQVVGGNEDLADDLRASSLLIAAETEGTTEAQDLFTAARAEYARLVGALYAQGYYSPVVRVLIDGREAATIAPLNAPASISRIAVQVDPGPPFAFSRANITPLAPETELPDGFAVGERARSGIIRESVTVAVDGWRGIGHAKTATSGQNIVADHAQNTLAADVTLNPGPRLRFGPLTITGEERMRERRIRKIAGLPEGEVYSPEELDRAAGRLRRTGVFSSVAMTEDENVTSPDLLGITATVVEQKTRRYSFGAELASFEGATLTGSWLHRNLLGGAERLTINGMVANIGAQASGMDYSLGVTLDRPATLTPDTTLSFHVDFEHMDEEDYVSDGAATGITFSHIFSDRLTARVGVEYSFSKVDDDSGDYTYRNLSVPLGLTWDSRDVKLDATEGYFLDATAMPFLGFGTTDSGARLTVDGRAYRSFGADNRVTLAGRVQAGAVFGSDLLNTPRDYLFYSGGGGTVRGQPYQSLGVNILRSSLPDFKIGGLAFMAVSAEVRTRITERIGVVGFVDAGSVGAQDFFDDLGDWHAGAGLGLRYDTGFGPIRLDVAAPVGGDTGEGVQIYVGIGQSF